MTITGTRIAPAGGYTAKLKGFEDAEAFIRFVQG